jgi:SMEK domain-containing protein
MLLQETINNLLHDISIVQHYIENSQGAGFSDMTRLLEGLSIKLFKASHGLVLTNKNLLSPNFPAIDLVDEGHRTAVQVTSNANVKKIRHTLKMFDSHNLGRDYDKLIIHGFVSCSNRNNLPSFCTILSIGQLVGAVADKNDVNLVQDLIDALRQHADFHRIHPYDDLNCLKIVLNCIDRNAVKHRMAQEGDYQEMVKGLNEITELISKGTINQRFKGKSVDDFQDDAMKTFMLKVRDRIGRIVGIVNQNRNGNSSLVWIGPSNMRQIDALKKEIITLSNDVARQYGIAVDLRMMERV